MAPVTEKSSQTRARVLGTAVVVSIAAIAAAAAALLIPHGGGHPAEPKLALRPPALHAPQTVNVTGAHHFITLDPKQDYTIKMPSSPLRSPLTIVGGHNVVLIGGEINIPREGAHASIDSRRGLLLKGQTGVAHVEGLLIRGAGLTEGIDLDQRQRSTVQIENVRVMGVHARDERTFSDNHPDVIQTWAGPSRLMVDRLTGSTDYQGLFLNPLQFNPKRPRAFDFRHVNIRGLRTARYLLWQASPFPLHTSDVWISPPRGRAAVHALWPSPKRWPGVKVGRPKGGDFVPAGSVGLHYKSPGYLR